jgi:hypothetical protein
MKLWILTISMMYGQTTYGYKFLKKENCQKIGEQITSNFKKSNYSCKLKFFPVDTENK